MQDLRDLKDLTRETTCYEPLERVGRVITAPEGEATGYELVELNESWTW